MGRHTWTTLIALALAAQGCADAAISADTARVQDLAALQARVEQLEQAVALLTAASAEHAQALTDVATQLTAFEEQTADQAAALQTASAPLGRAWDADGKLLGVVMLKKQGNVVTIDHPEYGPIDLDLDDEGNVSVVDMPITLYFVSSSDCSGVPLVNSYYVLDSSSMVEVGDEIISMGKKWVVTEPLVYDVITPKSTWSKAMGCKTESSNVAGYFLSLSTVHTLPKFPSPITLD